MLRAMKTVLGIGEHREVSADALPDEIVLAIDTANVIWRPSRQDDEDAAAVVFVAGVGRWAFDGIADAASRVQKAYPDLPERHCQRAARLIASKIRQQHLALHRAGRNRGRRRFDPMRADHDYFGGFYEGG